MPNEEGKFRMEVDASGYAVGGILLQQQKTEWKTVAYLSQTLNKTE
jgi:hypothetical protein